MAESERDVETTTSEKRMPNLSKGTLGVLRSVLEALEQEHHDLRDRQAGARFRDEVRARQVLRDIAIVVNVANREGVRVWSTVL